MDQQRRPDLRIGDAEREQTVERLRDAHAEGRLDADEFYGRMDSAYSARTFADLDALVLDLPAAGVTRWTPEPRAVRSQPSPQTSASVTPTAPSSPLGWLRAMPAPLQAGWVTWATAVLINVIIWGAVSLGDGLAYFWPIWVAAPWGAILLGSTALWWVNRGDGGQREIGSGS